MTTIPQERFPVRVCLPKDVTAILLCDRATSANAFLDRALIKMKDLLGVVLDKSQIQLLADNQPVDGARILAEISYIVQTLSKAEGSPTLHIKYNSILPDDNVDDDDDDDSDVPQNVNYEDAYRKLPPPLQVTQPVAASEEPQIPQSQPSASRPRLASSTVTRSALQQPDVESAVHSVATVTPAETIAATTAPSTSRLAEPKFAAMRPLSLLQLDARPETLLPLPQSLTISAHLSSIYSPIQHPTQVFSVNFIFPGDVKFIWDFTGDTPISEIKQSLWKLKHNANVADLKSEELYCLKYSNQDGINVELFDEDQLLGNVSIMSYWLAKKINPTFIIDFKKKLISKQEQLVNLKIGNLIGYGLYQFDYLKDLEVDSFRRKMAKIRLEASKVRDNMRYLIEPQIESNPCPQSVWDKIPKNMLQIRLHLLFKNVNKTLIVDVHETPVSLLQNFFPKNRLNLPEDSKPEDYILKVCGQSDYLMGDTKLIDFKYIRRCIVKEDKVMLSLIPLASVLPKEDPAIAKEEYDLIEDIQSYGSHEQLTVEGRDIEKVRSISLWDIKKNFRVQVVGCDNVSAGNVESIYVEAGIYHGGRPICAIRKTGQVRSTRYPRWSDWLTFELQTFNLPRAARLCITVYGRWSAKKPMSADRENDVYPLGWVNTLLMDYRGVLRSGLLKLNLWPSERANPIGSCVSNPKTQECASIFLRFDLYAHRVVYPTEEYANEYQEYNKILPPPTNDNDAEVLEKIISSDPLTKLDEKSANLLWMYRYHCLRRPEALPKVLLSARWNDLEDVVEVRKLLLSWADLSPEVALELLDANFAEDYVRAYAVSRLETLSDESVIDYLVQLVQVLKYEPYHDNALTRFLLKRALNSKLVAHHFFWYLKAEMEQPDISLRFALLLEAYLRGSGVHMDDLIKQNSVITKLVDIANAIKNVKSAAEKKEVLISRLSKITLPETFQLALNPKVEASQLMIEKCKYMDSKKLPLWLVFQNPDPTGRPIYIIFKSGDDLRQDMLTLQMISIMDKLWQQENLDLRMMPYGCLSTGNDVGMIEVVLNAETVSNIQQAYGGSTAAFRDQPIQEWIRAQHQDDKDYEKAVETFTLSCAGYCVATYVLGIGDRHNDNIMVTKNGHLFHIDFGHFLGNIKRKFGVKRERSPFVLTPDFVYVMGGKTGEKFQKFQEYCCQAFLILRRRAYMFINLFAMMLSTGIPELKSTEDIYYLRDALCLDMTEEEAAQDFRFLIFESLRLGWSTQLNWWLHNLAHAR